MYDDDWSQEIDFPEDITIYRIPEIALSNKQQHYIAISEYTKELYETACDIHGCYAHKVGDLLVMTFNNVPMGCTIEDHPNMSDNYRELGEKYEDYFKKFSFKLYYNVDIEAGPVIKKYMDDLFSGKLSEEENKKMIHKLKDKLDDYHRKRHQLRCIKKITGFNGYEFKYQNLYVNERIYYTDDENIYKYTGLDITEDQCYKVLENVYEKEDVEDYSYLKIYSLIGDVSEFDEMFDEFLKEIKK